MAVMPAMTLHSVSGQTFYDSLIKYRLLANGKEITIKC